MTAPVRNDAIGKELMFTTDRTGDRGAQASLGQHRRDPGPIICSITERLFTGSVCAPPRAPARDDRAVHAAAIAGQICRRADVVRHPMETNGGCED
jgi:hypothetical protein